MHLENISCSECLCSDMKELFERSVRFCCFLEFRIIDMIALPRTAHNHHHHECQNSAYGRLLDNALTNDGANIKVGMEESPREEC